MSSVEAQVRGMIGRQDAFGDPQQRGFWGRAPFGFQAFETGGNELDVVGGGNRLDCVPGGNELDVEGGGTLLELEGGGNILDIEDG